MNYTFNYEKEFKVIKLIIDQNIFKNESLNFYFKNNSHYFLPTSMFFNSNETFFNTQGLVKRTTKIIFDKKTKNSWQLIRKFFKVFNNKTLFLFRKDNNLITFNLKNQLNFKNFMFKT